MSAPEIETPPKLCDICGVRIGGGAPHFAGECISILRRHNEEQAAKIVVLEAGTELLMEDFARLRAENEATSALAGAVEWTLSLDAEGEKAGFLPWRNRASLKSAFEQWWAAVKMDRAVLDSYAEIERERGNGGAWTFAALAVAFQTVGDLLEWREQTVRAVLHDGRAWLQFAQTWTPGPGEYVSPYRSESR